MRPAGPDARRHAPAGPDARRHAPATDRNREPILEVLARTIARTAGEPPRVLEVASGTGEHAVFLAPRLDVASWQPTDPSEESRASIDAHREGEPKVLPAQPLDVITGPWPSGPFDLVVCINMIHIAPFEACEALARGAAQVLPSGGRLFLYGPYRVAGAMAPSNEAFDASLRARDPSWGVRDLEVVTDVMERAGFRCDEVVAMPANNLSVVFTRI